MMQGPITSCKAVQAMPQGIMTRAKKAKRDDRVVTYVRITSGEHARIAKIAEVRGYPHTIASVAAEMISRGLKEETEAPPRKVA
jgi:hypothetical protein